MYESQLLHPPPPDLDPDAYPLLTLTNCTIHIHRAYLPPSPVNLFRVSTAGPFRVKGILEPPPRGKRSLGMGVRYLKQKLDAPTPMTIPRVETFSLERDEAGEVVIWVLGASAWYKLSPSESYRTIFSTMTAQASLWLWLRDSRLPSKGLTPLRAAERYSAATSTPLDTVRDMLESDAIMRNFLVEMMRAEGGWEGRLLKGLEGDARERQDAGSGGARRRVLVVGEGKLDCTPGRRRGNGRGRGRSASPPAEPAEPTVEPPSPSLTPDEAEKMEEDEEGVDGTVIVGSTQTSQSSQQEEDGVESSELSELSSEEEDEPTTSQDTLGPKTPRTKPTGKSLSSKGQSSLRPRSSVIPILPPESPTSPPPAPQPLTMPPPPKPSLTATSGNARGDWHCTLGCSYTVTNARTREGRMLVEKHYADHGRVFSEAIQTVEVESGGGERVKNLLEKLRGLEQRWEEGRPSPLKGLGE